MNKKLIDKAANKPIVPGEVSENTLKCIYSSIKNFDKAEESESINFDELSKCVDDNPAYVGF